MEDRQLTCIDCGAPFLFTAAEQLYYAAKGYQAPRRCRACRRRRRKERKATGIAARRQAAEDAFARRLAPYTVLPIPEIHVDAARTLYVIGNGFDLMHGVHSSYRDFSRKLGKRNTLRHALETYLKSDGIWADFEESLGHLNYGLMLNSQVLDMFLDLYDAYRPNARAADFYAAVDQATRPAAEIMDILPRSFRVWVDSLVCDTDRRPLQGLIGPGRVLCFNYTEFIEELYHVPRENICYIHGCRRSEAGRPKERLVLGHLPGEEEKEWDRVRIPTPRFKDPHKRRIFQAAADTATRNLCWYDDETTKKCEDIIRDHRAFFDGLGDVTDVVVIGHSLSRVDWEYYGQVQRSAKIRRWYFSCHDTRDLDNIEAFIAHFQIPAGCITLFRT